jgi:hypothetical protein
MLYIPSKVIVYFYYWYFVDSLNQVEVSHWKLSATRIFLLVLYTVFTLRVTGLDTFIRRIDDIRWTFECKYNEYFMKTASPWSDSPYWAAEAHPITHTCSIGLFWTSDKPNAETSTRQHATLTRDSHPCPHALDSTAAGTGKQAYYLLNVNVL